MKNRLGKLLLTLALAVGLVLAIGITVGATETVLTTSGGRAFVEAVKNATAGDTIKFPDNYGASTYSPERRESSVTLNFTYDNSETPTTYTYVSGITIDKDLTIDLNGHCIDSGWKGDYTENDYKHVCSVVPTITVTNGATVNIIDNSEGNYRLAHYFIVNETTGKWEHVYEDTLDAVAAKLGSGVVPKEGDNYHVVYGGVITGGHAYLGGGICVDNGTLILNNVSIVGNEAVEETGNSYSGNGGGVYSLGGNVTMTNCNIKGNTAQNYGGGIYQEGGKLEINTTETYSSTISDNKSGGFGAAIYANYRCTGVTLTGVTVTGNESVNGNCGGIGLNGAPLTVTNCTFSKNKAYESGGAIYDFTNQATPGPITITDTTFEENSSGTYGSGGAVIIQSCASPRVNPALTITDCTFKKNSARYGGAINIDDDAGTNPVNVTGTTFEGNSATYGAGMYIGNIGGNVAVTGSTFKSNSATNGSGAGMYIDGIVGNVTVTDTTFTGDTAKYGAGVYIGNSSGNITLTDVTFDGELGESGAAVYSEAPFTINATTGKKSEIKNSGQYAESALTVTDIYFQKSTSDKDDAITISDTVMTGSNTIKSKSVGIATMNISGSYKPCVSLTNCTFSGYTSEEVSVLFSELTINSGCSFKNTTNGSAVSLTKSTMNIKAACTFSGNTGSYGGAIYAAESTINIDAACEFSGNSAGDGGAIALYDSKLIATAPCKFSGNTATESGGAIYASGNLSEISLSNPGKSADAVFTGNKAASNGTVLSLENTKLTCSDYNFINNERTIVTGDETCVASAVYMYLCEATITGDGTTTGFFTNNGDCIHVHTEYGNTTGYKLNITGLTFQNNTTSLFQTGVINTETAFCKSEFTMTDCVVKNNSCAEGATIVTMVGGELTAKMNNVEITDNEGYFGGICALGYWGTDKAIEIRNSKITGNKAAFGGGMVVYDLATTLENVEISGNTLCVTDDVKTALEQYTKKSLTTDEELAAAAAEYLNGKYYIFTEELLGGGVAAVSGEEILKGKVIIDNNTNAYTGECENLCFIESFGGDSYISADSAPTAGSKIGISHHMVPTATEPVAFSEDSNADNVYCYCYSDDVAYYVDHVIVPENTETSTPEQYYAVLKVRGIIQAAPNAAKPIRFETDAETGEMSYYAFNADIIGVDITVENDAFVGAEYTIKYNAKAYQLGYLDTDGNFVAYDNTNADALPTGFASKSQAADGTMTLVANSRYITAADATDGNLDESGRLKAKTKLATLYFKALSDEQVILTGDFEITGSVTATVQEAALIDTRTVDFAPLCTWVAPRFDIEIISDYIAGKNLITIYTKSSTTDFRYTGMDFVNLTDDKNAVYTYKSAVGEKQNTLNTGDSTTTHERCYSFVAATDWSIDDVKDCISVKPFEATVEYPEADFAGNEHFNTNGSTKVDLYDAVVACSTYNVTSDYFGNDELLEQYMTVILKSDVNHDKCVDMADVNLILANYTK